MEDPDNWEYITSVESVRNREDILSNILILSGKQYLEKYFKKKNLEDNVCFAISDSGYSNNKIRVQQLEHFDKCTWKKRKGAWKMLIINEASYHTNEEFMQIC